MTALTKLLPLISAFSILAILSAVVRWPSEWAYWLLAAWIISVASALLLRYRARALVMAEPSGQIQPPSWWHLLPAPVFVVSVSVGLILFLDADFSRQLLIFLSAALIALFWETVRRHTLAAESYPKHYLESASLVIHVAVIWLAAAGFFRLLLDPTILPPNLAANAFAILTVIMLALVFLLDFRAIWLTRYPRESVWLALIVESLLIGEFFWILNFLPFSPDVKAFLVALEYYTVAAFLRAHLDGTLRPVIIRRYVYFILIISAAVLVTAKWLV